MSKTNTNYAEVKKMSDELKALAKAEECIRILSENCTFKFGEKIIDVSPENGSTKETLSFDGKWSLNKGYKEVMCTEESLYNFFINEKEGFFINKFEEFIERIKKR